jgi:hypothetical protein
MVRLMTNIIVPGLLSMTFILGCAARPATTGYNSSFDKTTYERRQAPNLFKGDTAVMSDAAIQRVMSYTFVPQDSMRVAIYRMENSGTGLRKYYGYQYWRDEEFLETQENNYAALRDALIKSRSVSEAKQMPSILIAEAPSLAILREAAARLQADLILIYSVNSETFEKLRVFAPNTIKSYSTCELVLFDVRSGIVPFSSIVTEKVETEKTKDEVSESEARKRAENEAIMKALNRLGLQVSGFLKR